MFFANFLHYVLAFEFNLIVITVLYMLCQILYNNRFLKSITLQFSFPFPELKIYTDFFVKLMQTNHFLTLFLKKNFFFFFCNIWYKNDVGILPNISSLIFITESWFAQITHWFWCVFYLKPRWLSDIYSQWKQ